MTDETYICEYTLVAPGSFRTLLSQSWPEQLLAEYKQYRFQGGFAFDRGTEADIRFREAAFTLGLKFKEYWHFKANPLSAPAHQLFQFQFEYDAEYDRGLPPVWETYASSCSERGTKCHPFTERSPLNVDRLRTKRLDLMMLPNWHRPRIFLVSAKAKDVLESIDASGIQFRQCNFLDDGRPADLDQSPYFEMVVTGKFSSDLCADPAYIPDDQRCSVCALVNSFVPRGPIAVWVPDDVPTTSDFLFSSHVATASERFELGFWSYAASARVLAAMLRAGLTGIRPMAPALGIKCAGVFRRPAEEMHNTI